MSMPKSFCFFMSLAFLFTNIPTQGYNLGCHCVHPAFGTLYLSENSAAFIAFSMHGVSHAFVKHVML